MSFHAISRDEDRIEPIRPFESPQRSPHHSRNQSESGQLLPGPKNIFEYSATQHLHFADPARQPTPHSPTFPGEPQALRKRRREWWREIFVDALLVATSFPFYAVAGAVIRLHGKVAGSNQHYDLGQFIRGAATLFPLVFSVVVGRATIKLAAWKLERGTTLGLLERLMGSQTVGGTLITQWRLRTRSLLGLALILLWSLSPLGGQAVLRVLSTTTKPIPSSANITYVNTRQPSYSGYEQFYTTWFPGFATLFSASLLAPEGVKNSSMDLWGNVKIPYLSSLANVSQDANDWRQVPPDLNLTYSSLFGIPLSGLPGGNTTLNLQSTYLELTCTNITSNITRNPLKHNKFYNPGLISTKGPFMGAVNLTATTQWAIGYLGPDVTALLPPELYGSPKCLDCLPDNVTTMTFAPGLLLYQDFEGLQNVTSIYCTPEQVYIESTILCSQNAGTQSCAVTAQRVSTLPHAPNTLTPLSFQQTFQGLASLLPNSTQQISFVDLMQNYIFDPTSATFIQSAQWPGHSNTTGTNESRFLQLSLKDFGDRLGQIINAFLYGSMFNSTQFLTGAPFNYMQDWVDHPASFQPATSDAAIYDLILNQTSAFTVTGNVTNAAEVYVCSWPWMGLFLFATTALPIAAVLAAVLEKKTLAREYLGYVSSLARESGFVSMPRGGAAVDGMQRTRGFRNVRVRLGDVGDLDAGYPLDTGIGVALSVGQLAMGDLERTRRVDNSKLYL